METGFYRLDTQLTGYMPLPRTVLTGALTGTAKLLYAMLLDRGTLSRKNALADGEGRVYVIYPIEKLAEQLGKGTTVVKRCLRELEMAGLIRRKRTVRNGPNHIFLCLPTDAFQPDDGSEKRLLDGLKTAPPTVGKAPPNNRSKQPKKNNLIYQYREEESL